MAYTALHKKTKGALRRHQDRLQKGGKECVFRARSWVTSLPAPVVGGIMGYVVCFTLSNLAIYALYCSLPGLSEQEEALGIKLKMPRTLADTQRTAELLTAYRDKHYLQLVLFFSSVYLWKQAFSIPGSAVMNVLAGAVFGLPVGFSLVCALTASGATLCFLMSSAFAGAIVRHCIPHRLAALQRHVNARGSSLFSELLFLRLVPFTPNWLLNVCLPLLKVPWHLFVASIFIGLMPYNFVCVQAGLMITEMQSLDDLWSRSTVLRLLCIAALSLLPTALKARRREVDGDAHSNKLKSKSSEGMDI